MYDAIVVGGGPAGAATATHLARDGFRTLLLDRARFPRDKPCGEFFSPPVRGLLEKLGVYREVLEAGVADIPGAALYPGVDRENPAITGEFTGQPHPWSSAGGFAVSRLILDNLLWENAARAGAETWTGVTVRGLLRRADGAVSGVRTDREALSARVVIGADGGHSRVARELEVVRPIQRLQKLALVAHYTGVSESGETARVEMRVKDGFVCGYGPGPENSANLTLVVPQQEAREVAGRGAEAYADSLLRDRFSGLSGRLEKARRVRLLTCGTFGHTTRSPIADGALLVGDAAAFIDPFTGEGVYFALRGAELAAGTLTQALRNGDTSARGLAEYARARRREFGPKYLVCDLVERAVHQQAVMRLVGPCLSRYPALMNRILAVTGDMVC